MPRAVLADAIVATVRARPGIRTLMLAVDMMDAHTRYDPEGHRAKTVPGANLALVVEILDELTRARRVKSTRDTDGFQLWQVA